MLYQTNVYSALTDRQMGATSSTNCRSDNATMRRQQHNHISVMKMIWTLQLGSLLEAFFLMASAPRFFSTLKSSVYISLNEMAT